MRGLSIERVLCVAAAVVLAGCPGDDSGDETASAGTENSTNPTSTSSSTTTDASGSTAAESGSSTTDPTDASTGSSGDPATTDAPTSTGSTTDDPTTGGSSSTGNPNACDPVIPGEFNACVDENGNVDNGLCNWVGSGAATGFIGCLNSGEQDGANVCMISGCKDDCDCFAAPATGDATVVCRETLEGGGTACVLDCAAGQTCPDGMECIGNACFHPAAE